MSQRLGNSLGLKKARMMMGDDEVIAKKIKILKMTWELSTTEVNLFYIIALANYSTSYVFFLFLKQIHVF